MVKGYIFDYGGTLDTGGCHWGKMLWHAYERVGVPVTETMFREAYVHAERMLGRNAIISQDDTFRRTLSKKIELELEYLLTAYGLRVTAYGLPLTEDLYGLVRQHTQHSREVLTQLRQRYPMVLVSNFYGNMPIVLREFGLDGLFDRVIESAVVGIRKPDPQIFLLGVEALGLSPSEVTVVGDSMSKDILPAKSAGCHTVWLKGEGWTSEPEDERQADHVITDLKELLEII